MTYHQTYLPILTQEFSLNKNSKSLQEKSDIQLIHSVKKLSDNESFLEICRRHEKLFYKIVHKYSTLLTINGINFNDILDEKNFIIYHCILSYNPKKGAKFSSWIGNYARYLCLNSVTARKFILPSSDDEIMKHIEDNQIKNDFNNKKNYIENSDYIFNILGQLKDKRIIDIFKYRYGDEKKMIWSKIGKKMGISVQSCVNIHEKALNLVRSKMKSQNISDII